jgi:UDPglucose 6-dehydrogenase
MKVAVVGTGYVGLVSGACLAEVGHEVTCVDLDPDKVAAIERGEAFLFEPGLQDVMDRTAGTRLRATTDLPAAVRGSDLTMIAVGTPSVDGRIDLEYVRAAAVSIGEALRDHVEPHVVVVKSTVVPGTTEDLVLPALERASGRLLGAGLGVAMNPEFLREGNAVEDFMKPDRIVLGVADDLARERLQALYQPFDSPDVLVTTPRTAEAIKYTSNAVLATLISFSNEIGNLMARLPGVDVRTVMEGVYLDRRWSPVLEGGRRVRPGILTYLAAGCGFGGSCFPKDVQALQAFAAALGVATPVLEAVLTVNAHQPDQVVKLLERGLGPLGGRRIALLGVAFKPDTDDVRESPSLRVAERLVAAGAEVIAFDPAAAETARAALPDAVTLASSLDAALADVDGVAIMTSWRDFAAVPSLLAERPDPPLVVDGRRMLAPDSVARYGGIGLGPAR